MRAPLRPWRSFVAAALAVIGAAVMALPLAQPAAAQTFPPLTGRVVDDAGVLDGSTRATLAEKLKALEAQTTDQLVVATVASLDGRTIEDYANRLFRAWGLGQKDKNNGVLLIVAPNERKVRIEVGYGLEGTLTDAVSKLIIEGTIVPRFRAGDMAGGIVRGADDIMAVLGGDAADWQRRAAARPAASGGSASHVVELPPAAGWAIAGVMMVAGVAMFAMFAFVMLSLIARVVVTSLVLIHVLPNRKQRRGNWKWLDYADSPVRGSSWGSSSSSDSFSGGGGSSGGGGASGSW